MQKMFEESIKGRVIINIQCSDADQCLALKKRYGNVFMTGITAKAYSDLEVGVRHIQELQKNGIRVSAGLGDGASGQWKRALQLAIKCNTEHLNQVFPAAALSQSLIEERGNRTVTNALIRPSGKIGYVKIGTGPISDKEDSVIQIRAVAAMLKEMNVKSMKVFPVEGLKHLEELKEIARIAGEFGLILEPTGGIKPENVETIVRTCLDAGAAYIMPHLYGSLKNEDGRLDSNKMDMTVEAIERALK